MQSLPMYIYFTFIATVIITAVLFLKAAGYSRSVFVLFIAWVIFQSVMSLTGFYNRPGASIARFPLMFVPPMLFLVFQFILPNRRKFIDGLDLSLLTIIHVIRIPVEIVLYWLYKHGTIPEAMTFEGRNFDILAGISAPFIYYFGFVRKTLSNRIILFWNLTSTVLLINVVVNALLALPGTYQKFGFEQPNVAVAYFPFNLLPSFLVPLVFLSMFVSIRRLTKKGNTKIAIGV